MKVKFLGTGTSQGVPVIGCQCRVCSSQDRRDRRLRSSILVEWNKRKIVVDCGPDFRQQMLLNKVNSIDAILVTHGHKDHLGGLDDVRAYNYILKRPVDVYAEKKVQEIIKSEYSYAFEKEPYPGVPEIVLHNLVNRPFQVAGHTVIPVRATHFNKRHFVFGFRFDDFTYITDAVRISSAEKEKIKGSKVIVLNALRKEKHYSHFNLEEALALMEELQPEQGFLTHISHQMGTYREVSRLLPDYVKLAYDGFSLTTGD
ncbi:MAG: MBL fold metallo-hydrolase [Bacteroidetes bacterium]|nr:MBL fold metallo-hydrolase [Bacteroidota bacterium]